MTIVNVPWLCFSMRDFIAFEARINPMSMPINKARISSAPPQKYPLFAMSWKIEGSVTFPSASLVEINNPTTGVYKPKMNKTIEPEIPGIKQATAAMNPTTKVTAYTQTLWNGSLNAPATSNWTDITPLADKNEKIPIEEAIRKPPTILKISFQVNLMPFNGPAQIGRLPNTTPANAQIIGKGK